MDRDLNGVEAVQEAWTATARAPLWVFPVLVIVTYAILLAGLLALVVGIVPAGVMSYLVWTSVYRQLEGRPTAGG